MSSSLQHITYRYRNGIAGTTESLSGVTTLFAHSPETTQVNRNTEFEDSIAVEIGHCMEHNTAADVFATLCYVIL